jgi:hypothetical protein
MSTEKFVSKDFVYAGRRLTGENKVADCIYVVEASGKLGEKMLSLAEKRKRVVGLVYTGATFSATSAKGVASARYAREWPDKAARMEWEALDQEYEVMNKARRMEADAKTMGVIETQMLPLRELYSGYIQRGDYLHCGTRCCERSKGG